MSAKAVKKTTAKKKPTTRKARKSVAKRTTDKKGTTKKAPAKKRTSKAPRKKTASKAGRSAGAKRKTKKKTAKPKLSPAQLKERRAARAARQRLIRESRQRLLDRYHGLVQAYNATKGNTRSPNADGTEDYIDYAVSSYDRDFTLSLTEMERRRLLLVEDALKRIDRREYGNCLQCGQEIPGKRLEVEPWARYCIRCQELDDQGLLEDRPVDLDSEDEETDEEVKPDDDLEDETDDDDGDEEVESDEEADLHS